MPVGTVFIVSIIVVSSFIAMYLWWWLVSLGLTHPLAPKLWREIDLQGDSNYRLLVSAQCRPYQDWQAVGVLWSAKKNWSNVKYTRLLSCGLFKRKLYKYRHAVPSYMASDWATHPESGDDYPPYNRPIAVKEYFEDVYPPEEFMVVIDPDVIIRKPLDDLPVAQGHPVAQRYDYLHNNDAINKLAKRFNMKAEDLQPIGMPYIIHRDDLKRLAPLWLEYTEKIRNDPEAKEWSGWIAEMHSYTLAAAALGLKHTIRDDLADRTPYETVKDPYVLHYDLRHDCKDFTWDKRDFLNTDLLTKNGDTLPVPKSPPNDRFLEVFEVLNESLTESRKKI